MYIIYDILYSISVICYLPFMLLRRKLHRGFLMRLGIFPKAIKEKIKYKKLIWLHMVSVGEVNAAGELIRHLREFYPDHRFVISTVTKTGNQVAQKLVAAEDILIYAPLDLSFIVRKVVKLIKPQIFIITETEIWPNIVNSLYANNIPLVLVNGRISANSFNSYRLIRFFLKRTLGQFSMFCMQTAQDAKRIIQLGAKEAKVKVTGNMKFDIQLLASSHQPAALSLSEGERLFIAGSTHHPEEEIVLKVYQKLIKNYPNLRLLIAPRHIERTKEIEALVAKSGFESERVSALKVGNGKSVLILDSIGELRSLYSLADIVFIGGSLICRGGQNPIEPAIFGKAIIFGPHMFNFADIAKIFLEKQAAIAVKDADSLQQTVSEILSHAALKEKLAHQASELVQENKGASIRNAQIIKHLIRDTSHLSFN